MKLLYIWVEGNDDERFINNIILPLLEDKYGYIVVQQYANRNSARVCKFINSINSQGHKYYFLADYNESKCISQKKRKILRKYKCLDDKYIIIVKTEIESWYCAGLKNEIANKLHIPSGNTELITKEMFELYRKKAKYDTKIEYLLAIIGSYAIEIAKSKNKTVAYYIGKMQD